MIKSIFLGGPIVFYYRFLTNPKDDLSIMHHLPFGPILNVVDQLRYAH